MGWKSARIWYHHAGNMCAEEGHKCVGAVCVLLHADPTFGWKVVLQLHVDIVMFCVGE
jgi:hypothetical protein